MLIPLTRTTEALTEVALQATKDHGLIIDFALGPNQGSGVPAEYDDPGVMWDLWPFNVSIPLGGSYDEILPGWGTGELVSASTALVIDSTAVQLKAAPAFISHTYNGSRFTLDASSLTDVTDQVGEDGSISLAFPPSANGTEYQLFAYYQNHTTGFEQQSPLYLNTTVPQSPVMSFLQNGSRFNDHFSATGAQLVIDFWEKYLLDYNNTRDLIKQVGNYGWEDSMEFGNSILVWWTPGLIDAFEKARGYSIRKYLPLIYYPNAQSDAPLASPHWYLTNENDGGQTHVDDYRQTVSTEYICQPYLVQQLTNVSQLTELNKIYLETLTKWTQESLDSQYSAQVVYNLPMDMLANVPAVNGPECESLGFNHVIDAYRQFAGPANLAGKRVISSELGAQRNEAYSQTLPELIWDVKRSIVGSVNNFVSESHLSDCAWADSLGLPCLSILGLLPKHYLARLHYILLSLLQHARPATADVGVLRRLHELDRPRAIRWSERYSKDRSGVLAQEERVLRQELTILSERLGFRRLVDISSRPFDQN